jgi:hypothetical protein
MRVVHSVMTIFYQHFEYTMTVPICVSLLNIYRRLLFPFLWPVD